MSTRLISVSLKNNSRWSKSRLKETEKGREGMSNEVERYAEDYAENMLIKMVEDGDIKPETAAAGLGLSTEELEKKMQELRSES